MKKAKFYKNLKNNLVQCRLCHHFCLLKNNELGFCYARKNINGKLYSLVYGHPVSMGIDPIEKKPLFHFLPGSNSFSLGTFGCNFHCKNCQNYEISQKENIEQANNNLPYIEPKKIVQKALNHHCTSIAYTYVEPTIFAEYALDIMKLARTKRLKNIWVSNGFMSPELLKKLIPIMDAINVDLKSFDDNFYKTNCQASLKPVLENLKTLKINKIHLEVTTLIIPQLSDDIKMLEKIAKFIYKKLGADTPWHISRFSGEISWHLKHLPATNLNILEKTYEMAKKNRLNYVYIGNVLTPNKENTYCPGCGKLIIRRFYYNIERFDKKRKCPKCGKKINLIL